MCWAMSLFGRSVREVGNIEKVYFGMRYSAYFFLTKRLFFNARVEKMVEQPFIINITEWYAYFIEKYTFQKGEQKDGRKETDGLSVHR